MIQKTKSNHSAQKPFLYSTTSARSCPSTNDPFLDVKTSKPVSCIHLQDVSALTFLGKPGSNVSFESNSSFTH